MGWFGKRKDKPAERPDPPPEWAPYFQTLDRYDRFESHVRGYFKARGVKVMISDGVVTRPDRGEDSGEMGLSNIAQLCAQAEEIEWPGLIERHFDRVELSRDQQLKLEALDQDFVDIAAHLSLRLHEPSHVEKILEESVYREDVSGLVTMLCIDLPDTVHTVTRERASKWGRSDEELFEVAMMNTERLIDATPQEIDVDPETKIWVIGGESIYNASLVLFPDRMKAFTGKHGGFVSIPTRSLVLAIPFDDPSALRTVAALMHFTEKFEQDGPGSLSRCVWWHRDGKRIELPYAMTEKGVEVHPTEEFIQIMNELQ